MALIQTIQLVNKERASVHKAVDCHGTVINEAGAKYIQLDTFGTSERQDAGKVSQTIQLSKEAAKQLKDLIDQTFPDLS